MSWPYLFGFSGNRLWVHYLHQLSISNLLLRLQLCLIGFTIWSYNTRHVFQGVVAGEELMSKPVDDPAALRLLLDESGVSSQVTEHIVSQGYTTIALLGYAVPKADALEDFVKFLTPSSAGSEFQPFSPQVACLHPAVKRCFDATQNDPGIDSPSRAHGGDPSTVGTTTIFGNPSKNLGTAASFGGSSESGLQGWWWAERPISLWDYCNEWCGRDFEGSLFLAVACYKYEPGRVNREDWKFMKILYLVWWGELQTNMIYTELCLCIFTSNQQIVLEESEHVHVISQERI